MLIFVCFLSILSHQTTVTECLYLIVDTYAQSREYPEQKYWPDQSRSILEIKTRIGRPYPVLVELYYMYLNLKHEGDIVGSRLLLLICLKLCLIKEQERLIAIEYPLLILDFHFNFKERKYLH